MTVKVLITSLTWRAEAQQWKSITPLLGSYTDAPVYYEVDGRNSLVRSTTRKGTDIVYVASLGCLSDDEDDLIDFLRAAKKRDIQIICVDENFTWYPQRSLSIVLKAWKLARNNGAAKVGGQISAAKRQAMAEEKAERIRD